MRDSECIAFLQWALPRLRMRWPGYRKVRRQVCKRVARRRDSLGLADTSAYHAYLETHPDEWAYLDELCHIPISRFYRDRAVFEYLGQNVLPALATAAEAQGLGRLQVWSAGCGAGEEPYTLAILWGLSLQGQFPNLKLQILATDVDREQLDRARVACYTGGSLTQLPAGWIGAAFNERGGRYSLRPEFGAGVEFRQQDIRHELPNGPFELVLCRNLVFTYFEEELQHEIASSLYDRLVPGGGLVLGIHEVLPPGTCGFHSLEPRLHVYRREVS
jgi:chemotaxis protein methyltransferase CheR